MPEWTMDLNISPRMFKRVLLEHYFDFHGRASRAEFWNYIVIYLAVMAFAELLVYMAPISLLRMALTVWSIGCFVPTIGVAIRRLHDLNRSGWWLVVPLVPALLLGLLFFWFWPITLLLATAMLAAITYLLYLYVQPGMAEENRFGPAPQLAPA